MLRYMNILHIDSCALGDSSQSRQHTAAAVARLASAHEGASVNYRDLAASPLSHVSAPLLQVMRKQWNSAIPMHAELRAESLLSASLLQEFVDANIVVVGAPMHNYFTPSTLKAWLDRLLHLHGDIANQSDSQRVMLVTSGWGADDPQQAELMHNYEGQLTAAFKSIGVKHLDIARAGMN